MDAQQRTRSVQKQPKVDNDRSTLTPHGSRQVVIPMTCDEYDDVWDHPVKVRGWIDPLIERYPEIFPKTIEDGYQLHGHLPESKKMPGIRLRQLKLGN